MGSIGLGRGVVNLVRNAHSRYIQNGAGDFRMVAKRFRMAAVDSFRRIAVDSFRMARTQQIASE